MRYYSIRVELPTGRSLDRAVNAPTLNVARVSFENTSGHYTFDWRGLVVFVDGAAPAEETVKRRKRAA